ncbi:hypothetical protein [Paenibacillus sp. DMB5]|uniref:hypothetical protein n=1 Tax=Paenibacillus sp. DMB5 TaxID=1780103 RepID=UPI00076DE0F3|nr:hypothetical protein [Paenibacillus sp. DMB5]KUP22389.1 hypothetical protein AWJ19_27610 [Paenibacillus sp. DMB5]
MENVLIIWLNGAIADVAKQAVKAALSCSYSIEERDLQPIDNGFEFTFDDETGGNARIEFINDDPHLSVKITTDFSWEAIPLYDLVQSCFDDEEEA